MNNNIIDDIVGYIDFLRNCGYPVSVSCFDNLFSTFFPVLYEYEVHVPRICSYLKSVNSTRELCVKNKYRLNKKLPDSPYYGCCYAGVEEYVIPVRYNNKTIVCINVSGYRGKMKESEYLREKILRRCDFNAPDLYNELSENAEDMDAVLKFTNPLKYMFFALYEQCLASDSQENPVEGLYHKALDYIYNNYMNDISSGDVAREVNYSESYLRYVFSRCSGMTVTRFIRETRLKRAAELLKNTNLSIQRIANDTGFWNSNYFSTAFGKMYKMSPKDYRK